MAKKKKEEFVETVETIDADLRIEISNTLKSDSIVYSSLGFGDVFSNWKNYIVQDLGNIEKIKKDFYPKIGSTIRHYSGDLFKVIDLKLEYDQYHPKLNDAHPDTIYNRQVYVVVLEKIQ